MKATAQAWIKTDINAIKNDIKRLGVEKAADYQMDLIADRAESGDDRWSDITHDQMVCAMGVVNVSLFHEYINWEYVHAAHPESAGEVTPEKDPIWISRIIEHARSNGFAGEITPHEAANIINQNLY